ncbi:hypothetical protein F4806DRAFT_18011 [Annulohypoxylon nitens]|nr:hypothetical protein F4806DRAFT_18011 [Annulohypoxylon nitens]
MSEMSNATIWKFAKKFFFFENMYYCILTHLGSRILWMVWEAKHHFQRLPPSIAEFCGVFLSCFILFSPFHISSPEALSFLLPLIPNNRLSGPSTDSGNLRAAGKECTTHGTWHPKILTRRFFVVRKRREGRSGKESLASLPSGRDGKGKERGGAGITEHTSGRRARWNGVVSLTRNTRTRSLLRDLCLFVCFFAFFFLSLFFSLPMLMIYDDPCFMPTLFFLQCLFLKNPRSVCFSQSRVRSINMVTNESTANEYGPSTLRNFMLHMWK